MESCGGFSWDLLDNFFRTGLSLSLTPSWKSVCVVLDVIDVLVTR